ncbi:MAG TPA: hypothetical protein VLE02_01740 [Nitrosarchaeum sp.]|nr:hypothetical protein [Nitrosarchaeum sp.]
MNTYKTNLFNFCALNNLPVPKFEHQFSTEGWISKCTNHAPFPTSKIHKRKSDADTECCRIVLEKITSDKITYSCTDKLLVLIDVENVSWVVKDLCNIDGTCDNLQIIIFCAETFHNIEKLRVITNEKSNVKIVTCPPGSDAADCSIIFHLGAYMCIHEENPFDRIVVMTSDHLMFHLPVIIKTCHISFLKNKNIVVTQSQLKDVIQCDICTSLERISI